MIGLRKREARKKKTHKVENSTIVGWTKRNL